MRSSSINPSSPVDSETMFKTISWITVLAIAIATTAWFNWHPIDVSSPAIQPSTTQHNEPQSNSQLASTDVALTSPVAVSDSDFESMVLDSNNLVLVDFWADWCGPCHRMAPVLDEIAAGSGNGFFVAKLNVDANPQMAARYNVTALPTMLVFKGGQVVDQIVGVASKDDVLRTIGRHLTPAA